MVRGADGAFTAHLAETRAGDAYAFRLTSPAGDVVRLDPDCREIDPGHVDEPWTFQGTHCRFVDAGSYPWQSGPFVRPSREGSVVYELHVGSFAAQPTFAAVTAKLDELASLGINVIQLMPTNDFGGGGVGWGYRPELWSAVRPAYGAPDDLRHLVDEAHQRGIAVWSDIVVNHYSGDSKAPLFCFDGACPNGSSGPYFFPDKSPYQWTPWGPRPNFAEPEVARLLLAAATTWLDDFRGDGFRWDSVSNIRGIDGAGTTPGGRDLLLAANRETHQRGALAIAEDLKGDASITQNAAVGGFDFDAQWDGFGYDVTRVLAEPNDDRRDLGVLANALLGSYAGDRFARLLFLESHDTVGNGGLRLPNRIDGNSPESFAARRRAMIGGVLLMTAPGIPMLFHGEESLALGTFAPQPAPLPAPTGKGLQFRSFYRDLIALRTSSPDLRGASVRLFHRNDTDKVLAYERGTTIVLLNLKNRAYSEYDIGVPTAGPYTVRLTSENPAYGSDFAAGQTGKITARSGAKDGMPYTLPVALGPYSAMIFTR
jgi:1,4-alpha-glucan branching enzyme